MSQFVIREEDRLAYYGARDAFDTEGDLEPFKRFLMSEALMTWSEFLRETSLDGNRATGERPKFEENQ